MEELLSLKWNNHRSTFLHILTILRDKQLYTDATLACDGRFYNVHRLVLSTCSDYFCAMFDKTTTCKNPIIVLKDIKCEDLEALLDYMYLGEVNVRQADLASLIKSAECLRVKGLAVPDDEPPKKSKENSRRSDRGQSPPSKRRRGEDQDGREGVRLGGNRSKSPISHSRLSPFTSASDDQNRLSPSQSTSERLGNATSDDAPKVKVEVIDDPSEDLGSNSFNLQNDGFKEEADDTDPGGGGLPDDLPDFLQDSNSSYSQSYAGPSSFQPDLQNWQGDQVLSGSYSDLGFGPGQSQDGSQNTSGRSARSLSISSAFSSLLPSLLSAAGGTAGGGFGTSEGGEPDDMDVSQLAQSLLAAGVCTSSSTASFSTSTSTSKEKSVIAATTLPATSGPSSGSTNFTCVLCMKPFVSSWELKRHLHAHGNSKPYKCGYCGHRSNFKHNLKSHVQMIHRGMPFSYKVLRPHNVS